jgi:hypothetical protein
MLLAAASLPDYPESPLLLAAQPPQILAERRTVIGAGDFRNGPQQSARPTAGALTAKLEAATSQSLQRVCNCAISDRSANFPGPETIDAVLNHGAMKPASQFLIALRYVRVGTT